jgi:formylglycine-generating enzyme required for sulfatase activity
MILVSAGEFTMGSESGYANERPIHTLYVDEFNIDKYEVTNIMYKACVDAKVCQPPMDLGHYSNSRYGNHPVVFVDWHMANAYCAWREARLPTEAEWEKATRGTDRRTYSWGNDFDPMKANVFLSGLSDTNAVGMYENGKSPFGVYDLTGNVGEWTSSLYQSYPYNSKDGREDQISPDKRILRGGSFENSDIDSRTTSRFAEDPSKFSRVLGFRCARDATP